MKIFAHILLFSICMPILTSCISSLPDTREPASGTYRVATEIRFQLATRNFLLHVPPGYSADKPLPLVVVLHGAFSTATQTEQETGFSALADAENFLVAYPEGIGLFGYLQHWNAGHCCGKAADDGIDDVGFVAEVIATVQRRLNVDAQRIYLAGMSNGGMLTHRFVAERGELIAAAAVVCGAIGSTLEGQPAWALSSPQQPVSMLLIHGDADQHVPLAGGVSPLAGRESRNYSSLDEAVNYWLEANRCSTEPRRRFMRDTSIELRVWEPCQDATRVERLVLSGWEHQWRGAFFTHQLPPENPLHAYDGTQKIWNFFQGTTAR